MTIMMTSLFSLICIALCIRRRFIQSSKLSSLLQRSSIAGILLFIPTIAFSLAYYAHMTNDNLTRSPLSFNVITPVLLVVTLSILIAFFMTKGPIENTYFSIENGDVHIAINKNFIPANLSKSEQIAFVSTFTRQITSLENIRGRNIILKSHLITRGFRRVITKTLESEDVPFSYEEYSPSLFVRITLNLWYGGKTRYRILSVKKHPNDFKVHEKGHIITIKKT